MSSLESDVAKPSPNSQTVSIVFLPKDPKAIGFIGSDPKPTLKWRWYTFYPLLLRERFAYAIHRSMRSDGPAGPTDASVWSVNGSDQRLLRVTYTSPPITLKLQITIWNCLFTKMPYLIHIHYIAFLTHERWIEDVARSRKIYSDQCQIIEEKEEKIVASKMQLARRSRYAFNFW